MSGDRLCISTQIRRQLLEHARSELPNEACGLLSGDRASGRASAFHPARNAHASPLRYDLHPEDLVSIMLGIEQRGEDLVAIFHSHTRTPAVPSATDLREARYPDALHLLAALGDSDLAPPGALRAWRIGDGRAEEVSLEID